MVDKINKREWLEEESGKVAAGGAGIAVGDAELHRAVLCLMEKKSRPYEMLGFEGAAEIKELAGGMGVMTVELPISEREKVLRAVERTDLIRPLSLMPTVLSDEDKYTAWTGLVTSTGSAALFGEYLRQEKIYCGTKVEFEKVRLLQVNGAIGMVGGKEVAEESQAVLAASGGEVFPRPWPKLAWQEGIVEKGIVMPRLGPCSYLIVDQRQFDLNDEGVAGRLLGQVRMLANSRDFYFSFDQLGNLLVVALNERSVGILTQWAETLKKINGGKAHLFLGKGEIVEAKEESLIIKGYLPKYDLGMWKDEGINNPSFYSSLANLAQISGSRDETAVKISAEANAGIFSRIEVKREVSLHVGHGPDRHIGYKAEKEALADGLSVGNSTRLILLEGHAGSGKSRLIDEVIGKGSNTLVVTMDPAGRNIPGFSLANLADQIAAFLGKNPQLAEDCPGAARSLAEFAAKDENDKLAEINGFEGITVDACARALSAIAEKVPNFVLVIDDVHHIDRYSDGPIMRIVRDLAGNGFGLAKVVLSKRPEQRYASREQNDLLGKFPKLLKISLQEEDGRPKLDFNNAEIARDYVFYSFPEEIRLNKEDGTPKILGNWAGELGEMASTPFEMTSFLQSLLTDVEANFLIQKDRIELSDRGAKKLEQIRGKDLIIYHVERIREQLSGKELLALQAIALVGARMASELQLIKMLGISFKIEETEAQAVLENLAQKGFLKIKEEDVVTEGAIITMTSYAIWHENMRDIVLNNTMDDGQRAALAYRLLNSVGEFKNISALQFFSILHNAAVGRPESDVNFWKYYGIFAGDCLRHAKVRRLYAEGYEVSSAILNGLNWEEAEKEALPGALKKMAGGEKVTAGLEAVLGEALFALAENGYFLGKFEQVYRAAGLAEKIYGGKEAEKGRLQGFYRLGFGAAMAENKKGQGMLNYYYQKIDLGLLDEAARTQIKLKYAYRMEDKATCGEIFGKLGAMEEVPAEISRMRIRVELEGIMEEVKKSGIDGDVAISGLDLSEAQRRKVGILGSQLTDLRRDWYGKASSSAKAQKLTPIDELQILDLEGQTAALRGDYALAIELFGEYWRVSMLMDIFPEALRAAKEKGDVEIIKALVHFKSFKEKLIDPNDNVDLASWFLAKDIARQNVEFRRQIKGAIETYTEEGIKVAEKTGNGFWKFLLSVQRLRAICLYLDSQQKAELETLVEGLKRYVDLAVEDVKFINSSPWNSFIPKELVKGNDAQEFETCYYITPLIRWFRKIIHEGRLEAFFGKMPFESQVAVDGSKCFSMGYVRDALEEKDRKIRALL